MSKKKINRVKIVKAMEFILRNLNDETLFYSWLEHGVADGDISYGDLSADNSDFEDLDYYLEDDNFSYISAIFARKLGEAYKEYTRSNIDIFCA